jgi:muconolactone delta-isomerase
VIVRPPYDGLANDFGSDGDTLTVQDYTQPSRGSVSCDPDGRCQYELWEAWEEEANAALAAKDAGTVVNLYKVCGQRRVLVLLDVESHDELDQIWMTLPMARYLELKEVLPIREYEAFADDVRRRWQQQTA